MRRSAAVSALVAGLVVAAAAPAARADGAPRLSARDHRAIAAVFDRFVATAVRRRHVDRAWSLVTPALRGGLSRATWHRGGLPVYPYAAAGRHHEWTPTAVEGGSVYFDALLSSIHPRKVGPIIFSVVVRRVDGAWRVDSFSPRVMLSPAGSKPKVFSERDLAPGQGNAAHTAKLGKLWLVGVAGGLIALLVLPFALIGVRGVRTRRTLRAAGVGRRSELPPLPQSYRRERAG